MTTTTDTRNYVDFDEYVGLKLEKTRSTIRSTDLLTALAGVAAMFLGYLLFFVVLDQWVVPGGFGVAWRWVLLSTLMLSTIVWLAWKVGVPSFFVVNELFAAQEIEKSEPQLKSNLLNLIDLKEAGRTVNPQILKAMERQAAVRLQQIDVSQAVDHRPLIHTAYVLLAVIVVFCFYALLSPKKISNSIWRGLLPAAEVPIATITEILDVKPGDVTIPAHQPFIDIQVDLAGEIPAQVWLLYTSADGKRDQPIELRSEMEGQTRFKGQLIGDGGQGLMQDLTYFIRAGDATSRAYKITVEQPPYAEIESVKIEFPAYMKLQPVEQRNTGAIDAWEGAKVTISAKTNMPVRSGMLQFLDDPQAGPNGEEVAMSVTGGGRQLQAQWTLALRSDGTFPKCYRIHCKTEDGRVTTGHVINSLTIRPDLPPEITLLQPDRDFDAPANATVPLLIHAKDPDFELSYLYLNVERAGQKVLHEKISEGRQPKLTLTHELELAKLNAAVGETVEFWIEGYDNKEPRPNSKNTPRIKIRVVQPVSQKEAERQLAEQKEQRDQRIAESDPEMNQERGEAGPRKDGDVKDRQPRDAARPNDADSNPPENPKDDQAQDGQQGGPQSKDPNSSGKGTPSSDPKNGAGQPKSSTKKETTKDRNDGSNGQSGDAAQPNKPLKNDGTQDDEALRRINEKMAKSKSPKPDSSNDNSPKDAQEKSDTPQSANENPQQNPLNPTPENQSETGTGNRPKADKTKPPSDKNPEPGEKKDGSVEKGEGAQGERNQDPKPEKTSADENKSPPDADPERKEPPRTPKTGDKSSQPDKSDEKTGDSPSANEKPKDSMDESTDKANGSKPDTTKGENQDGSKSGQKPDQKSGANGKDQQSPSESDKNDQQEKGSQSNDNLPTGMNKQSPKQGSSDKDDAGKPQDRASDPNSKTNGSKEQVPDSSDAQKGTADGTEKGIGKPDRDPKSNPTPAKNDNVKRDPNEKPELRPGDPKSDPSKSDPSKSEPGKSEPGKSENGKKDSKPSRPEDQPREAQPPNASKSQDKAEGESTGSQPGKEGKSENDAPGQGKDSKQPGSGEKTDKPNGSSDSQGSKGSGSKKGGPAKDGDKSDSDSSSDQDAGKKGNSNEDGSGNPKPDSDKPSESSSDKKMNDDPSTGKKPGDSKPKGDPAGAEKKSGDKSQKSSEKGSEESGKGESGKGKSDKGEPGKGESGKGESGDGKGDQAGAEKSSGKPSSKPGKQSDPNGMGGGSGPGESDPTHGGDMADPGKSEEANLEYNRRASELILQKLKKDLERGETDPELLEQLGWTPAEMKQFADRLSKSLSDSKLAKETPDSNARQQQFQEMLKNLDLQKSGSQRSGEKEPKRDVNQVESKRTPPPKAYGKAYSEFTKDLARQKTQPSDKPAK